MPSASKRNAALSPKKQASTAAPNMFQDLLSKLSASDFYHRQSILDDFIAQNGTPFPYAQGDQAYFVLLHNTARSIGVVGDMTCWRRNLPLERVDGTNLWFLNQKLANDSRIDYQFVVDDNWQLDPFNQHRNKSGFGENSELIMPEWRQAEEVDYRDDVPHGEVASYDNFYSQTMNNSRDLRIYLPPGFDPKNSYPSFYVHDGLESLNLMNMNVVLDNLIADKKITPLVVVFVPPADRNSEYGGPKQAAFERFITSELVPFMDERCGTATTDPLRRGTMGASLGGHISLRLGYDYPQVFGKLASQSGSLWAFDGQLTNLYRARRPTNQRFYISTGTICDNTRINEGFSQMLKAEGYKAQYKAYNEGHSWGMWRTDLPAMLTYLFPAKG